MTIPRKHHYVPQVHIKKFQTDSGYNLYLKDGQKFINPKLSENIFAVKDLNSSLNENGDIDHKTIEDEFSKKWDGNFNSHYNKVIDWIADSIDKNQLSHESIQDSLKFFFEYSLVGYFRNFKMNENFQKTGFDSIKDLKELKDDLEDVTDIDVSKEILELGKIEILKFVDLLNNHVAEAEEKLKFPVPIPTDVKIMVPKECSCDIIIAKESSFLLPYNTALITRTNALYELGNQKLHKIYLVGLPIAPNVFLRIKNNEVVEDKTTDIYYVNRNRVNNINRDILYNTISQVLTTDKEMLTHLINSQNYE